jgi:hypothetical protein
MAEVVGLGLVLVNRRGGQVSCRSDEGGHIEDMVFRRSAKCRGVSDCDGSHCGKVVSYEDNELAVKG